MEERRAPSSDDVRSQPATPERRPGKGGESIGPRPRPGDFGATEDEQRRVVGQPREEEP